MPSRARVQVVLRCKKVPKATAALWLFMDVPVGSSNTRHAYKLSAFGLRHIHFLRSLLPAESSESSTIMPSLAHLVLSLVACMVAFIPPPPVAALQQLAYTSPSPPFSVTDTALLPDGASLATSNHALYRPVTLSQGPDAVWSNLPPTNLSDTRIDYYNDGAPGGSVCYVKRWDTAFAYAVLDGYASFITTTDGGKSWQLACTLLGSSAPSLASNVGNKMTCTPQGAFFTMEGNEYYDHPFVIVKSGEAPAGAMGLRTCDNPAFQIYSANVSNLGTMEYDASTGITVSYASTSLQNSPTIAYSTVSL